MTSAYWESRNAEKLAPYTAEVRDWVGKIKAHALKNYENDGWDTVTEAMDVDELADQIKDAKSYAEALMSVARSVKNYDEYRRDIQGTAF
jgi:hypothetical protein